VVDVSATGTTVTIADALTQVAPRTEPLRVITVRDSRDYPEPLKLPRAFDTLVIQAADGERPKIDLGAGPTFSGPSTGNRLVLRGFLITGLGKKLRFPSGIDEVVLEDCTVDPGGGRAADGVSDRGPGVTLVVEQPGAGVSLRLIRCMAGTLDLPQAMDCLAVEDSILDGQAVPLQAILTDGPPATIERSTLLGAFSCHRLEASMGIFAGLTLVARQQQGCVRFCYFAPGSLTPRRYRCAPESPPPAFTSSAFGNPAYAQLALTCPDAIAREGEDGREMGVWAGLGGPRRLSHLELRLSEYLPAGLVAAFLFAT
jgi:hypothetical protein